MSFTKISATLITCVTLLGCVQQPPTEYADGFEKYFHKCVDRIPVHDRDGGVLSACTEYAEKQEMRGNND